jgi:hypothetical protein
LFLGKNGADCEQVQSISPSDIMQRTMYGRSVRYQPYPYNAPHRYYAPSPSTYSPPSHSTYHGMQSGIDYNSYNASPQGLPWSRSNSYSNTYSPYESESTNPYTPQPPSFILPNTDPMASGNPYLVNSLSSKPQASQAWPDQAISVAHSQSASQIMTAGYALPSSDALMAFQSAQGSAGGSLRSDQALTYPTLGSQQPPTLSSERTLPNPSARNYSSAALSALDRQNLDSIPLSAASQRSSLGSLGWQRDTASSSSHVSSQTSCSSIGGSQDFTSDRASLHRESQDLGYHYLGYANSPQSTLPSNALSTLMNESQASQPPLSTVAAGLGSQRCRTVSNESSSHESPSTGSSSYGYTGATVTRSSQTSAASGQLSSGATYTRAGSGLARRESGAGECSADCSGCQSGSNRASIASINNLSSY